MVDLAARGARQLTTTEQLRLEAHVVKGVHGLIVVGLDLTCDSMSALHRMACDSIIVDGRVDRGRATTSEHRLGAYPSRPWPDHVLRPLEHLVASHLRSHLPSGTSSSPLSVAMIAVGGRRDLDQAQLDLD